MPKLKITEGTILRASFIAAALAITGMYLSDRDKPPVENPDKVQTLAAPLL